MTQSPYDPSQLAEIPPPPPSNGLGIAGFVVSLASFVTCGILSPIALVLSLIALFKPPRGFAIAGFVLSLAGCLLLALVGVSMFVGMAQFGGPATFFKTVMAMQTASQRVIGYERAHHELPDDEEGEKLIAGIEDGLGTPLRYERLRPNHAELRSAGADRQFDTNDDFPTPIVVQH